MYGQDVPDNYNHFNGRRLCHKYSRIYVLPEIEEIQYINELELNMAAGNLVISQLCKPKNVILNHMLGTMFRRTFTFNTKTPYSLYLKQAGITDTNRLDIFDKREVFFVKEPFHNNSSNITDDDNIVSERLKFINAKNLPKYDDKGICFVYAENQYYCGHQSLEILKLLYERTDIPMCEEYFEDKRSAGQANDYMHSLLKSRTVNNYRHDLPSNVFLFELPPYKQSQS